MQICTTVASFKCMLAYRKQQRRRTKLNTTLFFTPLLHLQLQLRLRLRLHRCYFFLVSLHSLISLYFEREKQNTHTHTTFTTVVRDLDSHTIFEYCQFFSQQTALSKSGSPLFKNPKKKSKQILFLSFPSHIPV